MQTLPSNSADKANGFQKFLALIIMVAVGWGVVKLLNNVLPSINELISNIWKLIMYGVPLAFLVIYVISNPLFIWGLFKTISWKLTKWFIKMDPLSVMDRYADYLTKKLRNLNTIKVSLSGKKEKLDRMILELQSNIRENLKKGDAALKQNEQQIASLCGTKVATDRQSLALYGPIQAKMATNLTFLNELSENWQYSIEKLRYTIDRKRTEHEGLREMAKALGEAEAFAKGDTEASKIYNESVKQLEAQVSSNIAKIEEFERNSKSILGNIRVEKQMVQDEGLAAIEEYRKSGELLLPDFATFTGVDLKPNEYDVVSSKVNNKPLKSKFNLNG
jgi:hypothetical protein